MHWRNGTKQRISASDTVESRVGCNTYPSTFLRPSVSACLSSISSNASFAAEDAASTTTRDWGRAFGAMATMGAEVRERCK